MSDWRAGEDLDCRFTLLRRVGSGGMGEVWLARDRTLDIEVALKRVPGGADSDLIDLLRHECRQARSLSHPNIVRVFDFHASTPCPYITMEWIDGRELCAWRAAPPTEVVRTMLPVVEALSYAHERGVVHRDLKCSNVLIDVAGRPRVTDFGIAELLDGPAGEQRLVGGGTRRRVSPQQRAGEPATVGDDIYALGHLLYELVSGVEAPRRNPVPGDPDASSAAPLISRYPIPDGLESLIGSMIEESPAARPGDMSAVAARLREILEREETPRPMLSPPAPRLNPPPRMIHPREAAGSSRSAQESGASSRRRRLWTGGAFALAFLAAVVVFGFLPRWVREHPPGRPEPLPVARVEMEQDDYAEEAGLPMALDTGTVPKHEAQESKPSFPPTAPAPQARELEPKASPVIGTSESNGKELYRLISEGLAALDSGKAGEAQRLLAQAVVLAPESGEARELLMRAEQESRLSDIISWRQKAELFEREERWPEAQAAYRAVLEIDAAIVFAQEGLPRARRRAELDDQMSGYLSAPHRLADPEILAEAESVVEASRKVASGQPRLSGQIDRLTALIARAKTPVEVVLMSDGVTEVLVYRVGRLGRFDRHELTVRPGRYTIVGSREGFRDVRIEVEIEPEKAIEPIVIRCEEAI